MRDYVHEHFAKYPDMEVRPSIKCKDGTVFSVQASYFHYCFPRETGLKEYLSVEVWRSGGRGSMLRDPEGYVPVRNVNRRIRDHGGPVEVQMRILR